MDQAIKHCSGGLGIWEWASNDRGGEPDVVMACCGDVPTLETLAAVDLLREHVPELKVRVINVVNLMKLQPPERASARPADARLRRALHHRQADHLRLPRLSVADPPAHLPAAPTTTTSTCAATRRRARRRRRSTWCVLNDLDRFHLVGDVIRACSRSGGASRTRDGLLRERRLAHKRYIAVHGEDMPEIVNSAGRIGRTRGTYPPARTRPQILIVRRPDRHVVRCRQRHTVLHQQPRASRSTVSELPVQMRSGFS